MIINKHYLIKYIILIITNNNIILTEIAKMTDFNMINEVLKLVKDGI